jgi:hypothetical protein
LRGPLIHSLDRFGLGALEVQRCFRDRQREHLERNLEQHPERAKRTRHEARDVVAGDVLHDLAAEPQVVALAVENARAQHKIAHRAGAGTARA